MENKIDNDNIYLKNLKQKIYNFLRWTEKYTKTDMVYLARGGSWLGFGQAISMIIAFLTSIAFANLLPPETYGIYKYVLSIVAIISIPALSGMDSAITRAVAQGFDGTLLLGLKEKLRFGILSTFAGLLTSSYYFLQGNKILGASFLFVAVCVPLWESFDIYNSLLNGKKLFSKFAKYYAFTQFISFFVVVGTLLISENIMLILLAYFVSNTTIRIIFFYKVTREVKPNKKIDETAISYGKHLSLMDIIGTFLGQFDKILIFHYLGAAELALYAIAIAPPEQIKGALKNINTLALPRFSSREKEESRTNIVDKTVKLGLLVSFMVIVYIILAPYFFALFFPDYIDAIKYSQVISISIIGASLSMFLYTFLESHKEQKKLYQFNIYSNLTNIIIIFIMIYYFGLWGAIIGRTVTRFILLGLSALLIKNS